MSSMATKRLGKLALRADSVAGGASGRLQGPPNAQLQPGGPPDRGPGRTFNGLGGGLGDRGPWAPLGSISEGGGRDQSPAGGPWSDGEGRQRRQDDTAGAGDVPGNAVGTAERPGGGGAEAAEAEAGSAGAEPPAAAAEAVHSSFPANVPTFTGGGTSPSAAEPAAPPAGVQPRQEETGGGGAEGGTGGAQQRRSAPRFADLRPGRAGGPGSQRQQGQMVLLNHYTLRRDQASVHLWASCCARGRGARPALPLPAPRRCPTDPCPLPPRRAAQNPYPEVDPAELVAVKSVGFLFAACAAARGGGPASAARATAAPGDDGCRGGTAESATAPWMVSFFHGRRYHVEVWYFEARPSAPPWRPGTHASGVGSSGDPLSLLVRRRQRHSDA